MLLQQLVPALRFLLSVTPSLSGASAIQPIVITIAQQIVAANVVDKLDPPFYTQPGKLESPVMRYIRELERELDLVYYKFNGKDFLEKKSVELLAKAANANPYAQKMTSSHVYDILGMQS